jgi:hypothetical protein
MLTQKVRTWDVLQGHPIAKECKADAQLALVCEYVDLYDDLQGMSLGDFIDSYFAAAAEAEAPAEATDEVEDEADEDMENTPSDYDDDTVKRPKSMVGLRVVYRFVGRNVLSDGNGVTSDETVGGITSDFDRTVAFTDVDGEEWPNVRRIYVHPVNPKNYREIHIAPREAKEIEGWLNGGKPVKGHPVGTVLRNMTVEFEEHPDRITFVVMNAKRPYVDRFVQKPNGGFEDDQKPTTRLFGEHCFRVRGKDWIVKVMTP